MSQSSFKWQWTLILLLSSLTLPTLRAGFVETFEDGINDSDWRLTTSTDPTIEPSGGNPDAYLRQGVDAATPTWGVGTTPNQFLGNYAKLGVTGVSFDLNIFAGIEVPDRNVTLNISTTFGTGNFLKGVVAYYVGTDISTLPHGWQTYSYEVDATSPVIPSGWKVFRGDGHKGTAADWRALMQDVEFIGLELGTPGYFYPVWIWDIGLDNVRISKRYRAP